MCDVPESTLEEMLLATLASPDCKGEGAAQEELLRITEGQQACTVHSLCALRALHRKGHAVPATSNGSGDPVSEADARWKIAATPAAVPDKEPERQVGNNCSYSPSDELGRGRFGIVYRARNQFLGRDVAMKVLYREHTDNEKFRQRFQRDARILARLDHPNIVKVYDGGQDSAGACYIAMEYIERGTLVQLTKEKGRLPAPLVAQYMHEIAGALAEAHRHGIQHRDVKPDNVMMSPTGAKLTDFNLAAIEEVALQETPSTFESVASADGKPPQLVGTITYMAPERLNGERGDHRSDIYSLGATFYSVAAGGYLFKIPVGTTPDIYMNWRWHHTKETPEPLTARVPGFPAPLAAIIHKCLEKNPPMRYQSFEELLGDLAAVRGEGAPALSAPLVARRPRPRRIALVAFLVLVAALAAVLLADKLRTGRDPAAKQATAEKEISKDRVPDDQPGNSDSGKHAERKPDTHKTEETGKPESERVKEEPKIKPIPKPLLEQLTTYDPTADDLTLLRQLLDLAARERARFLARSYGTFRKGLDELASQAPPPTEGEKTFRAWYLKAARDLADLSEFAVSSRLADFTTSGRGVSLVLTDGQTVSGEVKEADAETILVATEAGSVRVPLANLAPSNFTGNADLWKASLAFQSLSGSATEALHVVLAKLPTAEELLLWIPLVVRLAHEEAGAAATGRDFSRAHRLFERLGALQADIPRYFAHLDESDFKAIRDERDALKLFLDERFAEVATRYPESLAYVPAAEQILARFCARLLDEKDLLKKLADVDPTIEKAVDDQRPKPEDIYEKGKVPPKRRLFDFVGGPACVTWTPLPEGKGWDRQGREKPACATTRIFSALPTTARWTRPRKG